MKQAILYVFSGTGNTWAVAGYYQKALSSTFQTERVAITVDGGHMPNPQPYDLVALGFPVHAFNAPEIVVRFAKVLPASKKPCFLFTTSGEGVRLNDVSTRLPARILEKKGYRVLSVRHYVMPYNIIFRHSDAMVRQMVLYAKALVPLHASDVLKENKETLRYPLWERVLSFLFRIEWPFCRIEGLMMHADPHTCTLCKACVARCPMHGISVKNKRIHFSSACCIAFVVPWIVLKMPSPWGFSMAGKSTVPIPWKHWRRIRLCRFLSPPRNCFSRNGIFPSVMRRS